jgi:hypothetical protein
VQSVPAWLAPGNLQQRDRLFRAGLFCFLLGLYLCFYVGRPDSADGKALVAASASLAQQGRAEIGLVAASDGLLPKLAQLGVAGADGALYTKKGIVPALFWWPSAWVAAHTDLPLRALAGLLNPLLTALTAVVLYTLGRQLDYRPSVALLTALIYGVATLPYLTAKPISANPVRPCCSRWESVMGIGGAAQCAAPIC